MPYKVEMDGWDPVRLRNEFEKEVIIWRRLAEPYIPEGEMALRMWKDMEGKAKKHFHRGDPMIYDCDGGVDKLLKDLKFYDREGIEFAKERIGDFWKLRARKRRRMF